MKRIAACLFLLLQLAVPAFADALPASDAAAVIERNNVASKAGDVDTVVDCTASQIIAAVGGQAKYAAGIRGALTMMKAQDVRIVSHQMDAPSAPVRAGASLIVVVKEVTVLESHGRRIRTDGFTVAVRPAAGGAWKLIGGSGISQHPEIVPELFPGFPANYKFPPFTNTPM
jgi:hypothetical protein